MFLRKLKMNNELFLKWFIQTSKKMNRGALRITVISSSFVGPNWHDERFPCSGSTHPESGASISSVRVMQGEVWWRSWQRRPLPVILVEPPLIYDNNIPEEGVWCPSLHRSPSLHTRKLHFLFRKNSSVISWRKLLSYCEGRGVLFSVSRHVFLFLTRSAVARCVTYT